MLHLRRIKLDPVRMLTGDRLGSVRGIAVAEREYVETPQYPEILDLSFQARKKRERKSWHAKIRSLTTIEEKLLEINMPRYYGYKACMLTDMKFPYNCLPMTQHYTRTNFEIVDQLQKFYPQTEAVVLDSFVKSIKSAVQDAIEYAVICFKEQQSKLSDNISPREYDAQLGKAIVESVNRCLLISLSADFAHLSEAEVDLEPRHEAFWFVGGVDPPLSVINWRKPYKCKKDFENGPVDRYVQYIGKPYLALRHRLPLNSFKSMDIANEEVVKKVPIVKFDPRTIGYHHDYRHGTTIPGFWPGNPNEFGLLSYQRRDHVVERKKSYGSEDLQEAIHAHGIQSSFAWLLGQAAYQGFTTFNDITYPMCTQTIITNGQFWSFYIYQLNTTLIHSDNVYENPKSNSCHGTKEMKLFEDIDNANGKCIGFNDDVLKNLIHFYINKPSDRGIELKPYLGQKEKRIADIEDDKRRVFLERVYKHMTSNRPRHLEKPEVYMWEKIYKIDNKTRPLEKKRRHFELGIEPWSRRMDEHAPIYIPRCIRPDGPKSKVKFEKNYYP